MNFGVLALQGDFREHIQALARLGVTATEIRSVEALQEIDALIIPGGESTTMSLLAKSTGLDKAIETKLAEGMFVYGSCAGMILLASEILDGRSDQISFGAIDMSVRRNGFGRQVDSFETQLESRAFPELHGVFIRAHKIERVGDQVEVLATLTRSGEQTPVLVRSGRAMASSFHPELGLESPIHRYFVDLVAGKIS
ncbi:MAG: pyridoxal 5'-phosphate synthase glutaminase subunit PdxT [Candidatus Nanopelagicales bacterium]